LKIVNLLQEGSQSHARDAFAIDVLTGLSLKVKRIPSKYFYDDRGSELFQTISEQPDYYPTKKEFSILERFGSAFPPLVAATEQIDIIELGAGDGHKSRLLIDAFLNAGLNVEYYPIDISEKAMRLLEKNVVDRPGLKVTGVVAEYFDGISYIRKVSTHRKLVAFLGSNIGNLTRIQSLEFLRRLWKSTDAGDFALIGFDLKKDLGVLNQAYNDAAGYTREFNLNLLAHINRELGGEFDRDKFCHYGFYNPVHGAMESYLVSLEEQQVMIRELEKSFHFRKFEPIHLEYSFKFLPSDIEYLSQHTGFNLIRNFSDDERYFVDSLWKVRKL